MADAAGSPKAPTGHGPLPKIFPRNLTARAAYRVVGNPDSTRLESGVGNCYPGLEFDQRNLDRRFFPGLIFEFTDQGARVLDVDTSDPALQVDPEGPPPDPAEKALIDRNLRDIQNNRRALIAQGARWYLAQIDQGDAGPIISLLDGQDGMLVWRIIRGLEPGMVRLVLRRRPASDNDPNEIVLHGRRRQFLDPRSGVISRAYGPGELTQSLCSPWQHDFRDCGCHYWASNHPDIVLGEDPPGVGTLPSGASLDPRRAEVYIDWLRDDRSPARSPAARDTIDANRPFQLDHYEINARWEQLAVVVRGKEISSIYDPRAIDMANPLASPQELACRVFELAKLEHVLAVEYLYAYFSVKAPTDEGVAGNIQLQQDVAFIRHQLLTTAISEMLHLRWANQILWGLYDAGLIRNRLGPSLRLPASIPDGSPSVAMRVDFVSDPRESPEELTRRLAHQADELITRLSKGRLLGTRPPLVSFGEVPAVEAYGLEYLGGVDNPKVRARLTVPRRAPALRRLDRTTIDDFIAVEEPSGSIDGQYAIVTSTLRQGSTYPEALFQIASRIVTDGEDHYNHFRDIGLVAQRYSPDDPLYLRPGLKPADPAEAHDAAEMYRAILDLLFTAYEEGDLKDRFQIGEARTLMAQLHAEGERLATSEARGIPFLAIAEKWFQEKGATLPGSCPPPG